MRPLCGFILLAVTSLYASDQNGVCFFAFLPVEVRNKIAYYLDACETDEAFIARTKKYGFVPREHEQLVKKYDTKLTDEKQKWSRCLYAYTIDYPKIITLARSFSRNETYITTTNIETGVVTYENQLSKSDVYGCDHCFAVSRASICVASLQQAAYKTGESKDFYLDLRLVVCKVGSTRKIFRVPDYYRGFISIGFNKQATKVIVHARDNKRWGDLPTNNRPKTFYYMESLTKPEVHAAQSIETLDAYFSCRAICKPITSESVNGKII